MKNYPYILSNNDLFTEIVDSFDKPLMVIPSETMQLFNLSRRKVYIIIHDSQGRILVRTSRKAKTLDIPSTNVYAGEAREHAATRVIKNILKLNNDQYLELQEHTIKQYRYATFFMLLIDSELQKNMGRKALWLDLDELQGFVTHFTDMLGEDLLNFITQGHFERWLVK